MNPIRHTFENAQKTKRSTFVSYDVCLHKQEQVAHKEKLELEFARQSQDLLSTHVSKSVFMERLKGLRGQFVVADTITPKMHFIFCKHMCVTNNSRFKDLKHMFIILVGGQYLTS